MQNEKIILHKNKVFNTHGHNRKRTDEQWQKLSNLLPMTVAECKLLGNGGIPWTIGLTHAIKSTIICSVLEIKTNIKTLLKLIPTEAVNN